LGIVVFPCSVVEYLQAVLGRGAQAIAELLRAGQREMGGTGCRRAKIQRGLKEIKDKRGLNNKEREMNLEKSSLSKLVLGLCSQTQTHPTEPQDRN
jgi:hypothetical protein